MRAVAPLLLLAAAAAAAALLPAAVAQALKKPGWKAKFGRTTKAVCVAGGAANTHSAAHNTRWTFYGLPAGTPPPGGWPVYLIFPPWSTRPSADQIPEAGQLGHNGTCGSTGEPSKQFMPVESCMALMKKQCNDTSDPMTCSHCARNVDAARLKQANCTAMQTEYIWCRLHGHAPPPRGLEYSPAFLDPAAVVAPCFTPNGTWDPDGHVPGGLQCGFTSVNGQLWDMRIKQYLLANGVAVVQVNTASSDQWDWDSQDEWDSGEDKPFLSQLFAQWSSGAYGGLGKGVLNPRRLGLSGYSVGAQMVSWMIQLHGSGALKSMGAAVKAGAFFGGGTYACYRYPASSFQPPDPTMPAPLNQCANCNASAACMTAGCSNKILNVTGSQPCCAFCCPARFTEQHYHDHPADYASHPATFITQHSTVDENADLCAGLNYHREMLAHGGRSELNLIAPKLGAPRPEELRELQHLLWGGDERCYCTGQADEPAAHGSPDSKYRPAAPALAAPRLSVEGCQRCRAALVTAGRGAHAAPQRALKPPRAAPRRPPFCATVGTARASCPASRRARRSPRRRRRAPHRRARRRRATATTAASTTPRTTAPVSQY